MPSHSSSSKYRSLARWAGALYLAIILCGLFGELAVRATLVAPGDPAATAERVRDGLGLFRLGFLADSVMILCDVALAVLLYILFLPGGRGLSLLAAAFRFGQAAVLAANLVFMQAAALLLADPQAAAGFSSADAAALAQFFLTLHSHGYDIGLLLFGVHGLLLGVLIVRSGLLPRWLGGMAVAAGFTYLAGSYTRFLFPGYVDAIAPIYLVAIVSETSLCLWLLFRGIGRPVRG